MLICSQTKWTCGRPRRRDVAAVSTPPAKTALAVSKMAAVRAVSSHPTAAASAACRSTVPVVSITVQPNSCIVKQILFFKKMTSLILLCPYSRAYSLCEELVSKVN